MEHAVDRVKRQDEVGGDGGRRGASFSNSIMMDVAMRPDVTKHVLQDTLFI